MKRIQKSLDRMMVFSILAMSSLITGLLTMGSLLLDYRGEIKRQKELAHSLEATVAKPLGSLLYNGDEDLIRIYAQSVLANREIACIEIEDYYSSVKGKGWCDDDKEAFQTFEITSPIHFDGFAPNGREQRMENIGRVKLLFSDRQILASIKERILTFFGTQALKTFLVSVFILFLVRSMVLQHVTSIFQYFREYDTKYKGKSLELSGKRWTPEFDELTRSINVMVGHQEQIIGLAAEREHYYLQLAKVFYPHQVARMSAGEQLESTMPVGRGEAVVIAFDLVGSSQYQSPHFKTFLHQLISSCNEAMMRDYDPQQMTASAYRIKVMGDGFLCSVGYPLKVKAGRKAADVAVELAEKFLHKTHELARLLGMEENVYCGIGIAKGEIESFFPDTSPSEYDIFGRALIHATRYESCRRPLFEDLKVRDSIIVLQARVYEELSPSLQEHYLAYALDRWKVRDDSEAQVLYYRLGQENKTEQTSRAS